MMGPLSFIMQYEVIQRPVVGDGTITVKLSQSIIEAIESGASIDIRIRPVQNLIGAQHRAYYYGVMLPTIIEQRRRQTGVRMTVAEADLLCKKEAASGLFSMKEVNDEVFIRFKDLSLSHMTTEQYNTFIDQCHLYWGERGVVFESNQNNT